MVLYDAINERFKSVLLYGDDGKYLEERVLLNQMSLFIDLNSLDEYFLFDDCLGFKSSKIEKTWLLCFPFVYISHFNLILLFNSNYID